MEKTLVLINFNDYLGGGETLLVRFAQYLCKKGKSFIVLCSAESYIKKDLNNSGIGESYVKAIFNNTNYYYLTPQERNSLDKILLREIGNKPNVCLVTFCMRDLYISYSLSGQLENCTLSHLVLHVQDDLFLGQTILDKLLYKSLRIRRFGKDRNMNFNRALLGVVNRSKGLISMAEIINVLWERNFGISIPYNNIVPLPSFSEENESLSYKVNTKRIIWIGRIVDFKIPAIIAMITFVSHHGEYSLTIVGDGDKRRIQRYMNKNSLDSCRVRFVGEIPYDQLDEVINRHSIGYAMGTSLIELAKCKIPVIVALASYDHKLFERQICGGIFYNKSKGCDGSDLVLVSPDDINTLISDSINKIELDYRSISQACYEFAKDGYSLDRNFEQYVEIMNRAQLLSSDEVKWSIPHSSILRRFISKLV
jgi:glycosyltransferase involved in cell wall biosynthesis